MRRVHQLIIIVFISIIFIAQPTFIGEIPSTSTLETNIIEGPYGGVRLNKDDVSLLYLNGSFYQMGLQLGSLIQEEFSINYRAFHSYYEDMGISKTKLINLWHKQKSYVPIEVKEFIHGCADAMNLSFDDVACIWVAEGAAYTHHCSSFAAWGNATVSGELIHARSLEFPLTIKDPVTGSMIQDYPVIVIADPDDHLAFTYPTYAGYVIEDGMNEEGIAISNMWSPNNDQTSYGAPMGIRIFEALYKASSADEAIDILTSKRTYGYNFIVSDAKVPIGYAVETTASKSYAGTWDDPSEQIAPFWPIEDVVRRSNCFLDPNLALEQRTVVGNHIHEAGRAVANRRQRFTRLVGFPYQALNMRIVRQVKHRPMTAGEKYRVIIGRLETVIEGGEAFQCGPGTLVVICRLVVLQAVGIQRRIASRRAGDCDLIAAVEKLVIGNRKLFKPETGLVVIIDTMMAGDNHQDMLTHGAPLIHDREERIEANRMDLNA